MSQQLGSKDATETARRFSPALFGIIAICFLLPFVAITCSGTEMFQLQGLDLVTGTELGQDDLSSEFRDGFQQLEDGFGGVVTEEDSGDNDKIPAEPAAIVALALAIIGLVVGFAVKGDRGPLLSALIGILGVLALIALRMMFKVEPEPGASAEEVQQVESLIGYDWGIGWWIALLLFLVQPILHFGALRDRFAPRRPTTSGGSPSGAPPPSPPAGPPSEG
jgi:hypothetical protein